MQYVETDEWWWAGAWKQNMESSGMKADVKESRGSDGHATLWTHQVMGWNSKYDFYSTSLCLSKQMSLDMWHRQVRSPALYLSGRVQI